MDQFIKEICVIENIFIVSERNILPLHSIHSLCSVSIHLILTQLTVLIFSLFVAQQTLSADK